MNSDGPEHAKLLYRRTLEDRHADGGLEELLEKLGLEPDGTADDIDRILARLEEPDAFRESLRSQSDDGSFNLLLSLLDVSDVHPPESLRAGLYGETPDEMARLLATLRQFGLFRVKSDGEHVYLLLQPWIRHLLTNELDDLRSARSAEHRCEAPDLPFEQTLALCVNYLRGRTVRLTSKGSIFQRDSSRAEKTFKALYKRAGRDAFLLGITVLERLGCLRFSGGILQTDHDRTRVVLGGETEVRIDALIEEQWDLPLAIILLDALEYRRQQDDADHGWTPLPHLITRGEIFVNTSGRVSIGSIERRARDKLGELVALSMVAADQRPFPTTSYKITASGTRLCKSIYGKGSADVDEVGDEASGGAIVQPNLEILVPLEAPARVHWRVGCVAALKSVDEMCRYVLEKEYAQCVFGREGGNIEEWIALLSDSALHGVPDNVTDTLRSWLTTQGVVQVFKGLVIVLDQSKTDAGRAALTDAGKKLKATQAAPGVFITDSDAVTRTVTTLEQHGLRVIASLDETPSHEGLVSPNSTVVQRTRDALGELRGQYANAREALEEFDGSVRRFLEEEVTLTTPSELGYSCDIAPIGADAVGPWVDSKDQEANRTISTLVHEAVRRGLAIELILTSNSKETRWSILPDSVLKRGSRTCVSGFCPESEEFRVFPLDEIERVRFRSL